MSISNLPNLLNVQRSYNDNNINMHAVAQEQLDGSILTTVTLSHICPAANNTTRIHRDCLTFLTPPELNLINGVEHFDINPHLRSGEIPQQCIDLVQQTVANFVENVINEII